MNEDEGNIYDVLKEYVCAFETADADLMECLFWIDDSHFTEVEDFIAEPFGREPFLDIMDWIRTHPAGGTMKFYKTGAPLISRGRIHGLITGDYTT